MQPLLSESLLISGEGGKEKIMLSEDKEESLLKRIIKSLTSTFPMGQVDLKVNISDVDVKRHGYVIEEWRFTANTII